MSDYRFDKKDSTLTLETGSFRAERGSVLHSGIYNREMASSLAAGACIIAAGFFFAGRLKITAAYFLAVLVIFAVLFLAFRTYVFRDPVLRVAIDKGKGEVMIAAESRFGRRSVSFPVRELHGIRQDCISVAPENQDGVQVVEKIALQHGTVIPGFGKPAEFYTVELELNDGRTYTVYSTEAPEQADAVAAEMRAWLAA